MKKISFFRATVFILLVVSCRKDGGDVVGNVQIHYIDYIGNDLFNNSQRGYIKDSVRIYDYINNSKSLIYKPGFLYPYVCYFQNFGYGNLLIIPDDFTTNLTNNYATCIIHLKQGVEDTLIGHLKQGTNNKVFDQIWYNGVAKTDTFTIIK